MRGRPTAAGAREVALIVGLAVARARRCRWPSSTIALGRAPAAEVSAWFFLVPVVGVLTRLAAPRARRPSARLLIGLAAVSAGLWLVLGRAGAREGRLVDSAAPP